MLNYRFHPEALEEMLGAKSYIKSDDPVEGGLFEIAFSEALKWSKSEPLLFRCFEKDYRKVNVGKFRHSLVFRIRRDEIQILAVAHHSKKPSYWNNREI